ncbi:MAG: hypothetical protein ABR915_00525, partial [Thermoguttaceae bacterium]
WSYDVPSASVGVLEPTLHSLYHNLLAVEADLPPADGHLRVGRRKRDWSDIGNMDKHITSLF